MGYALKRMNDQGLGPAEYAAALHRPSSDPWFHGKSYDQEREWLTGKADFYSSVGHAIAIGQSGMGEDLDAAIVNLKQLSSRPATTTQQLEYLEQVINSHERARAAVTAARESAIATWEGKVLGNIDAFADPETKVRAQEVLDDGTLRGEERWDALAKIEAQAIAATVHHGNLGAWEGKVEAALVAKGLTPDEIAYVRERQGGTITKFDQDDADAVNARRGGQSGKAVDEQIEADLLAQGVTSEEIAYVRERQGGTITKFGQDDADAVNAMRVDSLEARLIAKGLTPDEIAYVRERQGGTITKFDRDDANAVNAMRRYLASGGSLDAPQLEASLIAKGMTPDEIAYVRERQGGTITKFGQDDADAVNAMRRYLAEGRTATAQEIDWLEYQDELADYYQEMEDYQAKADLWESEESMGAPEVNPDLAMVRAIRASFDSGEQTDISSVSDAAKSIRASSDSGEQVDLPSAVEGPLIFHDPDEYRNARQIIQGLYPEPPIEAVTNEEAAASQVERILNRGLKPVVNDPAIMDAIDRARAETQKHAGEYQQAFTEGRHDDAEKSMEIALNFAHVHKTLITRVNTATGGRDVDPDSPFYPSITLSDIADVQDLTLGNTGDASVYLRLMDDRASLGPTLTPSQNRAFQAALQSAAVQSQVEWNDGRIADLEQDIEVWSRTVDSGWAGSKLGDMLESAEKEVAGLKQDQVVLRASVSEWGAIYEREGGTPEIQALAEAEIVKRPGLWFTVLSMVMPTAPMALEVAKAKSAAGEEGRGLSERELRQLTGQGINSAVWTTLLPLSATGYGLAGKGAARGAYALAGKVIGRGTVRTPSGLVVSHVWNRRDRGDGAWFGHPWW